MGVLAHLRFRGGDAETESVAGRETDLPGKRKPFVVVSKSFNVYRMSLLCTIEKNDKLIVSFEQYSVLKC